MDVGSATDASTTKGAEAAPELSPLAKRLTDLFKERGFAGNITPFGEEVFTCERVAALTKFTPSQVGKAMVVCVGSLYVLTLLPGDRRLDTKAVAREFGEKKAFLPSKEQVEKNTGLVVGAITPLAGLEKPELRVIVDSALVEHDEINVSTGDLRFGLSVRPADIGEALKARYGAISKS